MFSDDRDKLSLLESPDHTWTPNHDKNKKQTKELQDKKEGSINIERNKADKTEDKVDTKELLDADGDNALKIEEGTQCEKNGQEIDEYRKVMEDSNLMGDMDMKAEERIDIGRKEDLVHGPACDCIDCDDLLLHGFLDGYPFGIK